MSIDQAELLKRELTDKWVVVASQVPELRRFESLTGQVKTVNMNCRALVEFDGPEDIGWYDIDPQFLTVVDGPRPKETKTEAKPAAKKKAAPTAKPATGGGSPLDKIRASGGAAAKPAAASGGSPLDKIRSQAGAGPAAKPAGGSPLDQIRAQAGGATAEEKTEAPAEEAKPAAKAPEKKATSGMSPLDQIRAQGGFKG